MLQISKRVSSQYQVRNTVVIMSCRQLHNIPRKNNVAIQTSILYFCKSTDKLLSKGLFFKITSVVSHNIHLIKSFRNESSCKTSMSHYLFN